MTALLWKQVGVGGGILVAPRTGGRTLCPAPGLGEGVSAESPRLESLPNNRNFPDRKIHMCHRGCRCRTCPDCGPRYGRKVRARLMQKSDQFLRPALFTLTVDRSAFGSPLDAFLVITGDGYLRRLMRLLGVKRWAWTLELQMKSGDGWPHWHLVIDLPPGGIDLQRAWRLWRDKWGLGGLDLHRKTNQNADHALLYVTKYLTKYPKEGFPDWILNLDRRVRWVQACRALGPVVSDREKTVADVPPGDESAESLPKAHRPLSVRMVECGELVDFLEIDGTVEGKFKFIGRLPREVVDGAMLARKAPEVQRDVGGPPYIVGQWADFKDLGNNLLELASANLSRCSFAWSLGKRCKGMGEYVHHRQGDIGHASV